MKHFVLTDQAEGGTAQNCMVIADPWFSWDDRDCAGVYGFICECSLDDCKQFHILTSVDSDEHVQHPFKLRNS